eukprot:TRINITY_DN23631_c0_g1_i1.p2 TRINITY_DN23631_c0_g1~~TRINITY_DN23631_c0_g1_i1.p2  ORF type:complete len:123 (+),score=29.44 TRINITY_DN23631_c0_g1_i1:295-663(+)
MLRVLPRDAPTVLAVADTPSYRKLARSQIGPQDAALEIGSSAGECTKVLSLKGARVLGVDNSEEMVAVSRQRCKSADVRFEVLNVLDDGAEASLAQLCRELVVAQQAGALSIFVDITPVSDH